MIIQEETSVSFINQSLNEIWIKRVAKNQIHEKILKKTPKHVVYTFMHLKIYWQFFPLLLLTLLVVLTWQYISRLRNSLINNNHCTISQYDSFVCILNVYHHSMSWHIPWNIHSSSSFFPFSPVKYWILMMLSLVINKIGHWS